MLASHMKPQWLPSALDSVLSQTRQDMQVIVCDSGEWIGHDTDPSMRDVMDWYSAHPLIEWVTLGQRPRLIDRTCPYAYTWNRIIESGLIRGRYVAIFTDDDLYYPTYLERMAGFLDDNPNERAVWCSQDRQRIINGGTAISDSMVLVADAPRSGMWLDNVDMLQVVFRRDVLDEIGAPWFEENPEDSSCRHADGLFLEKLGGIVGTVPNVPEVLVTHRYTPVSTYS